MCSDIRSAKGLSKNWMFHERTKHIEKVLSPHPSGDKDQTIEKESMAAF